MPQCLLGSGPGRSTIFATQAMILYSINIISQVSIRSLCEPLVVVQRQQNIYKVIRLEGAHLTYIQISPLIRMKHWQLIVQLSWIPSSPFQQHFILQDKQFNKLFTKKIKIVHVYTGIYLQRQLRLPMVMLCCCHRIQTASVL